MRPQLAAGGSAKLKKGIFLRIYIFFRSLVDRLTGESANFVLEFGKYIYFRIRSIIVRVSVLLTVLANTLSLTKDNVVNLLFWGRSANYRWLVQLIAVFVVGVFGLLQLYRQPQLTASAQTLDVQSIAVAENDLIVETGSTQTLIPKSRGRLDTLTYTVQGGDTISTIASKFNLKTSTILWSNGLTASSLIKPGQELKIPEGDGLLHTVKKGDTLVSIAKKYSANEQAIATVNWIDDTSQLVTGETIFIPNGEPRAPVVVATRSSGSTSGSRYIPTGGGTANPAGARTLLWPIAGGAGNLSQCPSWYHKAIDISDKTYPYIVAARSGRVVFAGVNDPYGYAREIIIDHGGGLYTQYAHLNAWAVSTGQSVSAGQIIGQMGRSGLATGVHLHFEVRVGGHSYSYRVINPQSYLVTRVC